MWNLTCQVLDWLFQKLIHQYNVKYLVINLTSSIRVRPGILQFGKSLGHWHMVIRCDAYHKRILTFMSCILMGSSGLRIQGMKFWIVRIVYIFLAMEPLYIQRTANFCEDRKFNIHTIYYFKRLSIISTCCRGLSNVLWKTLYGLFYI